MALLNGYAIRRTLDSGGLLPICEIWGFYDYYEDADEDLCYYLDCGIGGTFEIVHIQFPEGW